MPQPYQGDYLVRLDALSSRPNIAKHIGLIASLWAYVETELGILLAQMLNQDAQVAITIYTPVKSEPARFSMLEAVAKDRLPLSLFKQFQYLRDRVKKTGSERDKVMHATWGLPKKNARTIVLVDPRRTIQSFATVLAHVANSMLLDRSPTREEEKKFRERMNALPAQLEYKVSDFVQIEKNIKTRIREIQSFRRKLERRFAEQHNRLVRQKSPRPTP